MAVIEKKGFRDTQYADKCEVCFKSLILKADIRKDSSLELA